MTQFETKDSGERAEFDSGMQRDTEAGKPRFDLLRPLNVPYEHQFLTRVAALLGRGAVKYEERNWEKANSETELARMKSSAARHFEQWLNGEADEDHAAATVFNLLAHETTAYKMDQAADDDDDEGLFEIPEDWIDLGLMASMQDAVNKMVELTVIPQPKIPQAFQQFDVQVDLKPYLDAFTGEISRLAAMAEVPRVFIDTNAYDVLESDQPSITERIVAEIRRRDRDDYSWGSRNEIFIRQHFSVGGDGETTEVLESLNEALNRR